MDILIRRRIGKALILIVAVRKGGIGEFIQNPDAGQEIDAGDVLIGMGDATDDDVLEKACIRDAYGIFPVLSSERDNLYITMAARQLCPRWCCWCHYSQTEACTASGFPFM